MRSLARLRRNPQRGGAAVEFAIVLPVFCAILFGIIDYGWYFYQRFSVVAALRDGLRLGVTQSLNPSTLPYSTAKARIISDLTATYVPTTGITWGPTTPIQGSVPNETLTVTLSMPFTPLVGFVPYLPSTVYGSMTMLLEMQ